MDDRGGSVATLSAILRLRYRTKQDLSDQSSSGAIVKPSTTPPDPKEHQITLVSAGGTTTYTVGQATSGPKIVSATGK